MPKWVANRKKTSWFPLAKVKNGKYPKAETWNPNSIDGDGPIRGYVRICEWLFDSWWQFGPNFGPRKGFWLNFPKILWFFWDLGHILLIISKGAAFAKILVLSNIFDFSAVNLALKWTETVNFSCIPFVANIKVLKDFSNTVFFLLETTYGQRFSKIKQYFGKKGPKKSQKGTMNTESIQKTLKIFHFTNRYAILMKLTTDIYLNKVFHLAKSWGVFHRA